MTQYQDNNTVTIAGILEDTPVFNHEVYKEKFYIFTLRVKRLSEAYDYIKVILSERLFGSKFDVRKGDFVIVNGQFRSYNNYTGSGSRLVLSVFAKDIRIGTEEELENPNQIYLDGFVCKEPVYRTTPFGREIADVLLAVNRSYNKSDYIPSIAWGRNAKFCRDISVGSRVRIWGRIQSRDYQKRLDDETVVTKTAYEISIGKMELVLDEG
ncbi:MAG: single-stranded DNA-binding protein [Ruminococcaceae bacterium]|nr:single-stranded DNA-binding protein [Oscillospiraceae bacterium]